MKADIAIKKNEIMPSVATFSNMDTAGGHYCKAN